MSNSALMPIFNTCLFLLLLMLFIPPVFNPLPHQPMYEKTPKNYLFKNFIKLHAGCKNYKVGQNGLVLLYTLSTHVGNSEFITVSFTQLHTQCFYLHLSTNTHTHMHKYTAMDASGSTSGFHRCPKKSPHAAEIQDQKQGLLG